MSRSRLTPNHEDKADGERGGERSADIRRNSPFDPNRSYWLSDWTSIKAANRIYRVSETCVTTAMPPPWFSDSEKQMIFLRAQTIFGTSTAQQLADTTASSASTRSSQSLYVAGCRMIDRRMASPIDLIDSSTLIQLCGLDVDNNKQPSDVSACDGWIYMFAFAGAAHYCPQSQYRDT